MKTANHVNAEQTQEGRGGGLAWQYCAAHAAHLCSSLRGALRLKMRVTRNPDGSFKQIYRPPKKHHNNTTNASHRIVADVR